MNRGVELAAIQEKFGRDAVDDYREVIAGLVQRELLVVEDGWLRLTSRGRLLSNEVFEVFLHD
jgi:oxygen-independent coproporphyrinogen-3 oxidase